MYKLVLLLLCLSTIEAQNITDDTTNNTFDIGPYIQNFKTNMLERVKQGQNLTKDNLDRVDNVLEDFLRNFAKDLGEVISKQQNTTTSKSAADTDGQKENEENVAHDVFTTPSAERTVKSDNREAATQETQGNHFDEIKKKIRIEFPEVNEDSAAEIVVRLRYNLLMTRERLDQVLGSASSANDTLS